jgi:5-methylcytosine-specific restriction endonuclease McrA
MPIRPDQRHHYQTPEWRALSLRIRKERAGGRCECRSECGADHGGERDELIRAGRDDLCELTEAERCSAFDGAVHPITGAKVVLTVAHLDHTPGHDDEDNLRAFCQRCHNRYDMEDRRRHAHATRRSKRAAGDLFARIARLLPAPFVGDPTSVATLARAMVRWGGVR